MLICIWISIRMHALAINIENAVSVFLVFHLLLAGSDCAIFQISKVYLQKPGVNWNSVSVPNLVSCAYR